MSGLRVLYLAAHPDDAELSCSGTIMKHIDAGLKVGIVDLTQGEMGSRGTVETRYAEAEDATKLMGIHARVNLKLADGFFEINKESKRLIVEQIRRFQPSIVLANAIKDRHPDHGRGAEITVDAFYPVYVCLKQLGTMNLKMQCALKQFTITFKIIT